MKTQQIIFPVVLICIMFNLSGCDKVKNLIEKTTKTATNTTATTKPQNVQQVAAKTPMPTNALARVGSWVLTIDDFNTRLKILKENMPDIDIDNQATKEALLTELVNQQLVVVDAEKSGIANTKEIISAVDDFRRALIVRAAAVAMTENIMASDEEVQDFYDNNKDLLKAPIEIRAREIVVDSKEKADEIYNKLTKEKADFAETAKQASKSASAANGGDLGWLKEPTFQEMAIAMQAMQTGDVSAVFQGPEGFYIMKMEEQKEGAPYTFEEIKEEITQQLTFQKQQQAILDKIKELESQIKPEINKDLLK